MATAERQELNQALRRLEQLVGVLETNPEQAVTQSARELVSLVLNLHGIGLAKLLAILTEATLSFLGVGLPPTQPSLGTLIRNGNDYLLSGDWWISIFPGVVLALLILSVNLLGDWLRDALNPKLR